ncbi:MAG: sodium transporter, partial [Planctomycetia bacterium]|nr:sodium transporter [Planctomycetia bacterium]
MGLGFLDYSAIGLYLVATLAIGFWVSRRIKSGADFFLAGRSLPFWAVGLSLVATDIGGTDIIGAGGA